MAPSTKASMKASLFLEAGLTGTLEFTTSDHAKERGWEGAPKMSGRIGLSTLYEFSFTPKVELSGSTTDENGKDSRIVMQAPTRSSCAIPPGIPCFMESQVEARLHAVVNGVVNLATDTPFRSYGRMEFSGATRGAIDPYDQWDWPNGLYDRDATIISPVFETPRAIQASTPTAKVSNTSGSPVTLETPARVDIKLYPTIVFGLGEPLKESGTGKGIFGEAQITHVAGTAMSACNAIDAKSVPTGIQSGGQLDMDSYASVNFGAEYSGGLEGAAHGRKLLYGVQGCSGREATPLLRCDLYPEEPCY